MLELVKEETLTQKPQNPRTQKPPKNLSWQATGECNISLNTADFNQVSPHRIEVIDSYERMGTHYAFGSVGIGSLLWTLNLYFNNNLFWIPAVFITLFLSIGGLYPFLAKKTGVFDKQLDYFWAGSIKLTEPSELHSLKIKCRLSDVVGVQFLDELVEDTDGDYYIYEINLVFASGNRLNVVMDTDGVGVKTVAQFLVTFLKVPLFEE